MVAIGYYWDEQTTKEFFYLLREYEDLFPASVAELKGIKGDIGEMKIMLKPYACPVKHRPYRINPREIDKILEAILIFSVDEVEWIRLIVIQNKKDSTKIRVL